MREQVSRYAVGAGAGVAAAVLFMAAMRTGALAVLLAYVSPLPVMIAALGWGLAPGLAAVLVSGLVMGSAFPDFAIVYMLVIAAPAWLIAAFAVAPAVYARKPDPALPRPSPGPGAIALLAAGLFIALGAAQLTLMQFASGGYAGAVSALAAQIREALDQSGAMRALPTDMSEQEVAEALVQIAPIALAVGGTLMHLVNLYLAARAVQLSGRLGRPWRDIPTGFRLPPGFSLPTLAGLAAALFAPSPYDGYGLIVACALGAVYVLSALAALHALSRFSPARPLLLGALYFACAAASQWVLPALALLGLAESFADLRGRAARSLKPRPKT
jgi:hypothetical protein